MGGYEGTGCRGNGDGIRSMGHFCGLGWYGRNPVVPFQHLAYSSLRYSNSGTSVYFLKRKIACSVASQKKKLSQARLTKTIDSFIVLVVRSLKPKQCYRLPASKPPSASSSSWSVPCTSVMPVLGRWTQKNSPRMPVQYISELPVQWEILSQK